MKKITLSFRAVVLSLCAGAAWIGCAASVRWLEQTHNFGAFSEDDGRVECAFRMVNDGDEPVAIVAARASCGCTVPSYERAPVMPGDTALVRVSYNPTGRPGKFSKTVTVDLSYGERVRLVVEGTVIGASNTLRSRYPVEAGPLKLRGTQVPFGTVKKGKTASATFDVYNATDAPVVARWEDVPDYVSITAISDTIPAGERGFYSMVFNGARSPLYGVVTAKTHFVVPGADPVEVDLAAIVEEDFSGLSAKELADAPKIHVSEQRVDFGTLSTEPVSRTFTVGNLGKNPLKLRRVYTGAQGVKVSVGQTSVKRGEKAEITVTVDPKELTGNRPLNAPIQIVTNDPDQPLTMVRIVGLR